MSATQKYFGTDGMRGRFGEGAITPEFMSQLAWATGKVFKSDSGKVYIARDTRTSGPQIEQALLAGFTQAGLTPICLGILPTPACAYLTQQHQADVGVVISASHNLAQDNGVKFFSHQGVKLNDEVELAIEAQLDQAPSIDISQSVDFTDHTELGFEEYKQFCMGILPQSLAGLTIVLDCANGATQAIAPAIFTELGCTLYCINIESDGHRINADCGSTAPEALIQAVQQHQADIGIAFDGDGDRVILVDAKGEVVDGDEILYIIAKQSQQQKQLTGGVIGTKMSNMGLEKALQTLNIDFKRTKVGDRYVIELMRELNWSLGGESSGHIICMDNTTTGDGIIGALRVLAVMITMQQSLHDLKQGMNKFPHLLINVPAQDPQAILTDKRVQQAYQDINSSLNNTGRVLLRASGTEPVIRILVEAEQQSIADKYAEQLAQLMR